MWIMRMMGWRILAVVVVLGFVLTSHADTLIDLSVNSSYSDPQGALFNQDATHPAGTGNINSFLRVQKNGTEQGFNTNANNQLDNKGGNFTHALALNTLATTTISGVDYYGFILDINQVQAGSTNPLLSLDKLQIFTTNDPSITGYNSTTAFGLNADKVYDLDGMVDNYIKLDSSIAGSGSGTADMSFFLKKSLFTGKTGNYLVLYSSFGGHFASNDGFEEWAALTRDPVVSSPAPLPSTAAMGALLLAALGIFQWHQNRYQTAIPAD